MNGLECKKKPLRKIIYEASKNESSTLVVNRIKNSIDRELVGDDVADIVLGLLDVLEERKGDSVE